jgi:hypothetical protein
MPLKSFQAKTITDFLQIAQSREHRGQLALYRGQDMQGNLLPGVARKDPTIDTTERERETLRQFKLMGGTLLTGIRQSSLELLVVAQHHGMKTRLLDWSSNPLVALYFASSSKVPGEVYVYMLYADGFEKIDAYDRDPFLELDVAVIQPYLNNPRISAQHGWFTLHPYRHSEGRFMEIGHSADMDASTIEIRIPASSREDLRSSLKTLGIDSHTLMPDLGGLSQYLNERFDL